MNPCKNTKINNSEDDYGNYRKLGGEVESRNAEHRIGMTPEQRRATLLAETEDVAREDQIFLVENSGVSAMAESEMNDLISQMKANASVEPIVEISEENWVDKIETPIGDVKMGEHQKSKLFNKGREKQYGMLLETLSNPDVILEEQSKEDPIHERDSVYLFIKTFQKEDGSKYVHFESVTVRQDGLEVSISSHMIRENQLRNKMKSDRLLYKATALDQSTNLSAEQSIKGGSLSSTDKGSDNIGDMQDDAKYSLRSDVQEIIDDYESGDNGYLTIDDVAERLDGVLISYDGDESIIELENILNDYRQAQVDAKNWGYRMDSGGESEFESALYGWLNATEGQPLFRDGSGALSDADLSYANDPFAKALGKSQRSKAKQAKFAERERKAMRTRVAELVEKLGIGERVELIEGGEFDNERKARAKGWYDAKSGKIVINLANHTLVADIERTLLHEAVSHHGLRELFGKQFDTFLDNVFRSANYNIRTQIVDLATRNGWDFRTATEEYLAQLAEDTNFEALENNWSFWSKIKQLFMDMLESIGWNYQGPTLTDNELRYLLWRSYENMVNPGRHRSILGMAEDVVKREKFGIGTYNTDENIESQVAEGEDVKYSLRDNQGNPIDEDGKLIVEQVSSIDEITDADFDSPTRSIQLPSIPPKVDEAIGANGKPIVIKKNVFEKNKKSHKDLTPKDSRAILLNTLYYPDLYGQNQKNTRPYNWILIHLADTNTAVLVEVNENKDNVEIVNWHYINDDAIERKKSKPLERGAYPHTRKCSCRYF